MASIRIDAVIVRFAKAKAQSVGRLKGKPLSVILAESLRSFLGKGEECFSCPHHQSQLADLELGRQKMALKTLGNGKEGKSEDAWVTLRDDVHDAASVYAVTYKRSLKIIAEQAMLENLTRPSSCATCPLQIKELV
jgi:hypothetical protein